VCDFSAGRLFAQDVAFGLQHLLSSSRWAVMLIRQDSYIAVSVMTYELEVGQTDLVFGL